MPMYMYIGTRGGHLEVVARRGRLAPMASVIVCGTARRLVPPDRALVSLGVSVVANDPASALDQVSDRSAVLARLLGELGVAEADWVTDGVSVAEEWEFRRDTRTLVG